MSEGTQNISDEQPVVGEPASHPHQAVVVGEPPEDVAPVLGEPAFANGLQDQQLILPPSAEETSANGVQSSPHIPFHEEGLASLAVEESPNLQNSPSADASESGVEEMGTRPLHAHEVGSTDAATPVFANTHSAARSIEEEPASDIPDFVEVTHIVDSPSESSLPWSEVPTENPFSSLDEDPATATGEILTSGTHSTDGAPAANAPSTPDEISLKGLGNQQEEASLSSAAHEKQSTENHASTQSDTDDQPLEGSKAVNEDVGAAELEEVGKGDTLAQESDAKEANLEEEETGSSVVQHPLTPELDGASEGDALVQGNDTIEEIPAKSETISREVGHVLSREAPQSEASTIESSTPQKDIADENHAVPIASELQSNEEMPNEAPLTDSSVASKYTRDISVEECLVNQSPAVEASFPPAANGDNDYQHGEDGVLEREQDLPKDDDDASAEVEKPSSRIKLPLIFTGLAIAAVGVAVASFSRPH